MSQNQQPFDVHDVNAVLGKFAQLRQALRQLDDDITGLIYIAASQVQKEQADMKAKLDAATKAANPPVNQPEEPSN